MNTEIEINEIFTSIDGEVSGHHQGALTTFIRFNGCNLRCWYCDTKYTWEDNATMTVEDILKFVSTLGCKNITITGGEPLMQEAGFSNLVQALFKHDYNISVETNGCYFPPIHLWHMVNSFIVDWKWDEKRNESFFLNLRKKDFIKFIIANKEDFKIALDIKRAMIDERKRMKIPYMPKIALSPLHGELEAKELLDWMLLSDRKESKDLLLNIQIHKYIGVF